MDVQGTMTTQASTNQRWGVTLIELMIVIAIIAVIAMIAIPNLLASRVSANETVAIGTMRSLITAQSQFKTRGLADNDFDGQGEFGMFAELTGRVPIRGTTQTLRPTVLQATLGSINANGEVVRSGYQFRMFLPGTGGIGLGEQANGGAPAGVHPQLAEIYWCAYAWPTNYPQTGVRTFFVNQQGSLTFSENGNYTGPGGSTTPGAALRQGGLATHMTGPQAAASTGRDGSMWFSVGS